ncbi:hypothetical protein GCM10025863_23960 [Microbacterium suwonense]|uniref:PLD phosphodiesterase domain-containing protein n=1 Tax=Microbacterium suwonense TaxID=683047 RepID=A0ABM8FVQ2_9MICO|nr:hypothetical protein GCM10025863_23960 [Microbacterium suwonense]
MLEPQTRATLTEQLTPPTGYQLSHAVGTTFTLDLATALSVPLSFASHHVAADDDTIGILDAVRRVADKMDIFAQAGEISMGAASDLVALLEESVHPVHVNHGLFHPKVWFLEYAAGDHRAYRFLCASRNLTEDHSWDTLVRLDGTFDRGVTHAENAPLADLLEALPRLVVNPLPAERAAALRAFADRLRAVSWELPSNAHALRFHALGIPGADVPDFQGKRALIISPFATEDGLRLLRSDVRTATHLLSRATTLDALPAEAIDEKLSTYVLDEAAIGDDLDPVRLNGLHAKVVIVDRRDGSHVFLGSANATRAAWHSNVEVMVEITGPRSTFGVEATLDALGDLKEEYITEGGVEESEEERAKRRLESMLRDVAAAHFTVRVLPGAPHSLRVWADAGLAATVERASREGISLRWHLLTRADLGATLFAPDEDAAPTVTGVPLTDITPFICMIARDAAGNDRRTIVLAALLDDVPSRKDAIVARQLTDRASFLRLLTLMLELSGNIFNSGENSGAAQFAFGAASGDSDGSGVFEALVRALGKGHQGLDEVRRIIDFVRENDDGRNLLPDGFDVLWSNVWRAYTSLNGARR